MFLANFVYLLKAFETNVFVLLLYLRQPSQQLFSTDPARSRLLIGKPYHVLYLMLVI